MSGVEGGSHPLPSDYQPTLDVIVEEPAAESPPSPSQPDPSQPDPSSSSVEKKQRKKRVPKEALGGGEEGLEQAQAQKRKINYVFTEKRRKAFYDKCVPANRKANEQRKEQKQNRTSKIDRNHLSPNQ